ncbi:hypothetical protein DER44DRAFT_274789 [Fusarium oxysporum]|nr:hypothetical protein DER44DRAFT_274789 [Fusarium oxysporum]
MLLFSSLLHLTYLSFEHLAPAGLYGNALLFLLSSYESCMILPLITIPFLVQCHHFARQILLLLSTASGPAASIS